MLSFGYVLFWVCVVGLCFGSFYNVVILRSLSGESVVYPPSKCPACGKSLYWWHNVPVLSFLLLKGKCYFCKKKISIQYPLVELITMVLFAFSYIKYGFTLKALFMMFWFSCFLIMTVTDLKEKLVDCNIAIAAAVCGIIFSFLYNGLTGFLYSFLGLVMAAIVIETVARLGFIFVKSRAMGEADTYVAAALGAIFGIQSIGYILLYSFAVSMLFIIPTFLYNRYRSGDKTTVLLFCIFLIFVILFKLYFQNYLTMSGVAVSGIVLALSILKTIGKTENRNYLPFVPALSVGALFYILIS